jgi:hypothetical protein
MWYCSDLLSVSNKLIYVCLRCYLSELAELMGKVQSIREEIKYLKKAVSDKLKLIKQNERLQSELAPIVDKSKVYSKHVIRLCRKLLNEGLDIAKKERAYQSSLIAQRIDGIGAKLEYDPSPPHSAASSPNARHSARKEGTAGGNNKRRASRKGSLSQQHHAPRSRSHTHDDDDLISECSVFSIAANGTEERGQQQQQQEAASAAAARRASIASSLGLSASYAGTGTATGTGTANSLSAYDDPVSVIVDPDCIWKVGATARGHNSNNSGIPYSNTSSGAPALNRFTKGNAQLHATDPNIIRNRLKQLQYIRKADFLEAQLKQQQQQLQQQQGQATGSLTGTATGTAVSAEDLYSPQPQPKLPVEARAKLSFSMFS